jgi:serine/threonine protein kinase
MVAISPPHNPSCNVLLQTAGQTLDRLWPHEQARVLKDVVHAVLRQLDCLHGIGYIHLDVAARNVLLVDGVGPQLIDFNFASRLGGGLYEAVCPIYAILPYAVTCLGPVDLSWTYCLLSTSANVYRCRHPTLRPVVTVHTPPSEACLLHRHDMSYDY